MPGRASSDLRRSARVCMVIAPMGCESAELPRQQHTSEREHPIDARHAAHAQLLCGFPGEGDASGVGDGRNWIGGQLRGPYN